MDEYTMIDLLDCLQEAMANSATYIGVLIEIPNLPDNELIVNTLNNINEKMDYYMKNYNDDLTLKYARHIRIVDFAWGHSLDDVCEVLNY